MTLILGLQPRCRDEIKSGLGKCFKIATQFHHCGIVNLSIPKWFYDFGKLWEFESCWILIFWDENVNSELSAIEPLMYHWKGLKMWIWKVISYSSFGTKS